MDNPTRVHREGFLQKYSTGPVKSLKKKWFVLRDQEFKVYNNPNDAMDRANCQDMVYIHDIQGVRKLASGSTSKCAIEVVSRFRKYTLVAPNPIEQDKWIKSFHDAMRNVRMRSQSSPISMYEDRQEQCNQKPITPPEVRKHRISAAECLNSKNSSSKKKRLLSDSWIGKKLTRKSASVDDELLDPDRHDRHLMTSESDLPVDDDERSHIYDVVSEFKTITEAEDNVVESTSDTEVFEEKKDDSGRRSGTGNELYAPVAPDNGNVVEIVVKDDQVKEDEIENVKKEQVILRKEHKIESVIADESTAEAFGDPTYIEELHEDRGVEELRKMIRDSGLEFDDPEDDYEKVGGDDDEGAPAMAKLKEMLGTM